MKLKNLKINLPINFNFLILYKKKITILVIYNQNFKIKLFFNKNKICINKNLNCIVFKNTDLKKNFYKIENNFLDFLKKLNYYYFIKIKFKGKGYKIGFYKKKIINFLFNKSHKNILVYNNIKIKKVKKYKAILLKNNNNKLKNICNKIIKIRDNNEYTNRGLRLSRQKLIKRKGKKGTFV